MTNKWGFINDYINTQICICYTLIYVLLLFQMSFRKRNWWWGHLNQLGDLNFMRWWWELAQSNCDLIMCKVVTWGPNCMADYNMIIIVFGQRHV